MKYMMASEITSELVKYPKTDKSQTVLKGNGGGNDIVKRETKSFV